MTADLASPGTTSQPIQEIRPGILQIGQVRLDKKQRIVTVPAVVNLRESPVEYLLVANYGKIHESVFRTEAHPIHVQLALILLGAQGAGTNAFPSASTEALPGDPVGVEVRWTSPAGLQKRAGEDFVLNRTTQRPLTSGDWSFTGSIMYQGTFLAEQEGSIIALYLDPVALINNPRPGREDDENWLPDAKALPPEETKVNVIFQLRQTNSKKPPQAP